MPGEGAMRGTGVGADAVNAYGQAAGISIGEGRGDPFSIVPEKYRDRVRSAFQDEQAEEIILAEDLTVYQHIAEGYEGTSPYFSPIVYKRQGNARRFLALPNKNTAKQVWEYTIPAGTTILQGSVAPQVGVPGFGPYAVGGGQQIYLSNPSVAIRGNRIR